MHHAKSLSNTSTGLRCICQCASVLVFGGLGFERHPEKKKNKNRTTLHGDSKTEASRPNPVSSPYAMWGSSLMMLGCHAILETDSGTVT